MNDVELKKRYDEVDSWFETGYGCYILIFILVWCQI